jgi:ABC-type multidrug transport system permease subunit
MLNRHDDDDQGLPGLAADTVLIAAAICGGIAVYQFFGASWTWAYITLALLLLCGVLLLPSRED